MIAKSPIKVLFISMPFVDLTDVNVQKYLYDTRAIVNLPYGLLTICSYLNQYAHNDVEMKIINVNDELVTEYRNGNDVQNAVHYFEKFIEEQTRQYCADLVGISLMFSVSYKFLDMVTAQVKKILPDAVIVVGGSLATVMYKEIALRENIDAVCYGEGEIPLQQFIDRGNAESSFGKIRAFVTKKSLAEGVEPTNMYVENLDTIPAIDFSYVNLSNFNFPKQKGTVYTKTFSEDMVSRIIYVSRGCPYNCNFCAGFNVHGKRVRFFSINRIINDVRTMIDNEGLTDLFACDDAFLIDKKRAKTILREFVKLKINVYFPAILMRNIDEEVAELLFLLGNTFQYTSMESGSEYVLKHIIKKPLTKSQAKSAVENLRKYNISVLTNIVVGSPEETDEHRQETLKTLYDIGFSWVFIMIALPVPGSRLHEQCKKNGYIIDEFFCSPSLTKCNISTPSYSPEYIEWYAYMMNLYTNFVHNYNLRMGKYDECITSFSNVAKSYPNHAFAYYGLMKAYEGKGDIDSARKNQDKFEELVNSIKYWQDWVAYFN
ncbi:MAG: radical SAM protein, partial [Parabacteroides sp.]|nr:radical SAM protein [Parabacteroides sp.]